MDMQLAPPGVVCSNPIRHAPNPGAHLNLHHVVPLSWGGPDVPPNRMWLCPNCHELVHSLLNEYVRAGGKPALDVLRQYPLFLRRLAKETIARNGGVIPRVYTAAHRT